MANPKQPNADTKPPVKKRPASKAKAPSASASASAILPPPRPLRARPPQKAVPEVAEPKRKRRTKEEMLLAREAADAVKVVVAAQKEVKLAERLKGLAAVAEMENEMAVQDADIRTPQNASHSARTHSNPMRNMAPAPEFGRSDSEVHRSDTETLSEYQGEDNRSQWADESSEEGKSKAAPKFVEVDEQEDFQELTPMVKKVKTKGTLFTREAINGQRLKHSDDAGLDQKSAKVPDPKEDASMLVTIHCTFTCTCSPLMKRPFSIYLFLAQPMALNYLAKAP